MDIFTWSYYTLTCRIKANVDEYKTISFSEDKQAGQSLFFNMIFSNKTF